jgi:hypothetical protein
MARQSTTASHRLANDEITVLDPADGEVFESLFKRTIHEGEKELMLAVLEDAINSFQRFILAGNEKEKETIPSSTRVDTWKKRGLAFLF